jgi:hypothetical protein
LKALQPKEFTMQQISFIFQLEHIGCLQLFDFIGIEIVDYFIGMVAGIKNCFRPKNLNFY